MDVNEHSTTVINVQPPTPTTALPAPPITSEPKRRVSMAAEPHMGAHDNLGYEPNPRRKISSISQHSDHVREDMGPVRKKSILHNSQDSLTLQGQVSHLPSDTKPNKKKSLTESIYSNRKLSPAPGPDVTPLTTSWIYSFCSKCRGSDDTPSWEPLYWQRMCPYPLCPSYRQFSRMLSLILLGLLIWGVTYGIMGPTAAPGGQLFGLALLTVCAHFGGWLMTLTTLPALIGMLCVGIIFGNVGLVSFDGEMHDVIGELRKFALVIILTRAGLEMDPEAFKKVYFTILKMGLVPWTIEAVVITIMSHFLLELPWMWGLLLGSVVAAVSPAVVVPCLFRLRSKGYGVAKGIPTLIIAVAGIDDATSVAIFGIVSSIMFSKDSLGYQIAQGPVSVIGGIGFGILWGLLAKYVPEKGDPFVVPLRTLMLLTAGLISVFGSELIGFDGAGPLAVVAAAFVSAYFWTQQGWEIEENPVSTAFEIFWMIFEPILFGITGAQVKFSELEPHTVSIGVGCLAAGVIIRIICTVLVGVRSGLNLKEKVFVALSWMSKATVQAALGPVALNTILKIDGTAEEQVYGRTVMMICVLSIIVTAPLGAILITISGPRLLTKTRKHVVVEGWRRSHRPSLHDISIIDEEEERDPDEEAKDPSTAHNTAHNGTAHSQTPPPTYTMTHLN